ncbi:MAG: hypothetical protein ACI86H_001407, partial [bacterium]
MNLINPWGLLALASIPAIIILYRFVLHGENKKVSALFLWQDQDRLSSEGTKQKKPPITLPMILEIIAVILLCLVIARFEVIGQKKHPHIGVIIDRSASMLGGGGEKTPFQETLDHLKKVANSHRDARITVILSGSTPQILGGRPLSIDEIEKELKSYPINLPNHDLISSISILNAMVPKPEHTLIFSDNVKASHPRLVRVGKASRNSGFIAASWKTGQQPFVVVAQYGGVKKQIPVKMVINQDPKQTRQYQLKFSTSEAPFSIPVSPKIHRIDLFLPNDNLKYDNHITLVRPQTRQTKIGLQVNNKKAAYYFKKLSSALVHQTKITNQKPDLIISNQKKASISENQFLIQFPTSITKSKLVRGISIDAFHSLMEGFDTQSLVWYAFQPQVPKQAKILLQAGKIPLIWIQSNQITINIDLKKGNFFQHNSFPIFFFNLLNQIEQQKGGLLRWNFHQGELFSFQTRPEWKKKVVKVHYPNQKNESFTNQHIQLGE